MSVFGDLLRRARREAGLTQEALAERAGLSARGISDLERGITVRPHRDTFEMLVDALDLEPDERREWESLRRRTAVRKTSADAQSKNERRLPISNLPTLLTTFVGREQEMAEVRALLEQSATRLVTLTGPGGIGKTRLGLALAGNLVDLFPDGVFLIELAPVRDSALVTSSIAQGLGVRETGNDPLIHSLTAFLAQRQLLLILDNFEHVAETAPIITDLLGVSSRVKIVVTSRMRLRLRGEHEYRVPPLAAPSDSTTTYEELGSYPATRLFIERVREVRPAFQVTSDNADAVAAICRRLDGLPLAIELAAARSTVLSPQAILARLDQPLVLLTSGPRDVPERLQTIRATIQWSYKLLAPSEQQLLRRLSVFVGGWTLEAAASIDDETHSVDVLDDLTTLVDANLIADREQPDGEPRFGMLEIVREFGLEALQLAGELDEVHQRHAEYFCDLVQRLEPCLYRSEQIETLDRLELEHTNIRAALAWLAERCDAEQGLALSGALWRFWWLHGHIPEGRGWYERFLRLSVHGLDPKLRAIALTGAGILAERAYHFDDAIRLHEEALSIWFDLPLPDRERACWSLLSVGNVALLRSDFETARKRYDEAIQLARRLGDPGHIGRALFRIGNAALEQGNVPQALNIWQQSADYTREAGDVFTLATTIGNIGISLVWEGEHDKCKPLIEEALALHRCLGNKKDISNLLLKLGSVDVQRGRNDAALVLVIEGLAIARDLGDRRQVATALKALGDAHCENGDIVRALESYREGLLLAQSVDAIAVILGHFDGIVKTMHRRGQVEDLVTLIAASEHIRQTIGVRRERSDRFDQSQIEQITTRAEQMVSETSYRAAWENGYTMSLDEAISFALERTSLQCPPLK